MLELGGYIPTAGRHGLLILGAISDIIGIIVYFIWSSENGTTAEDIHNNKATNKGNSEYTASYVMMVLGILIMFIAIFISHHDSSSDTIKTSDLDREKS